MPSVSSRAASRPTGLARRVAESFEVVDRVWTDDEYVNLAHGRPLFGPDPSIRDALEELARALSCWPDAGGAAPVMMNNYRWNRSSATVPSLAEAAFQDFRRCGLPVSATPPGDHGTEVVAGNGVTQLYWAALWATVDSGAKLLAPAPTYGPFVPVTEMLGVRFVPIATRAASGKLQPAELADALRAHPETGGLLLINPANPSGAIYSNADYSAYAAVLRKFPDVWVIEDASYDRVFLQAEHADKYALYGAVDSDGLSQYERSITLKGLAKAHGLTQLRVGVACGPSAVVSKMHTFITMNTIGADEIAQHLAAVALERTPDSYFERIATVYRRHAELVHRHARTLNAGLNRSLGTSGELYVSADIPEAGFFAIYWVPGLRGRRTRDGRELHGDERIFEALMHRGLLVLPGSAAGMDPEEMAIRVTLSSPTEDLRAGLRILEGLITECLPDSHSPAGDASRISLTSGSDGGSVAPAQEP